MYHKSLGMPTITVYVQVTGTIIQYRTMVGVKGTMYSTVDGTANTPTNAPYVAKWHDMNRRPGATPVGVMPT